MEVQFFALNLEPLKFEPQEPSGAVERFELLEQAAPVSAAMERLERAERHRRHRGKTRPCSCILCFIILAGRKLNRCSRTLFASLSLHALRLLYTTVLTSGRLIG